MIVVAGDEENARDLAFCDVVEEGGSFLREWRVGSFQRVVPLPAVVEGEKAKASYKHGVLTIELPKVTEQVTRKITVSVE